HGKLDDYSSIGPVDTEQVGDLISIRDNSGKWLLGLEVETEIGDHILAEDGEVLYEDPHSVKLFDIRNFPLSHFTYDASLPYAAPSSALYWTACGQVTVDNLEYADYVGDRDERKRGIQFYPEIGSILTWDRDLLDLEMYVNLQEMGEVLPYDWVGPPIYLWDIDELRLALPLHGSFKKVSFENDYIITESGGHVFVWDWDARLVIQEPATDIFVTRDARKYVVVRRDSTCETIYHGDTTNIGVRQFVAYDEGEMTFKTVEARGISGWSTGGPTQWSAEMEYIVWNWQGEPVREYSEEYSGTRFPSPERPGELLNNVAMNTVELEYVSVNGNSVLVDDGFDQRTYQLGEDGLGVIGAPDRKKFLAVTRSGKAKIWTIELNFDPDAYLSKFKWLNDD
ncbi:MAG: hypothetical protein R3301_06090, partial [Saprospiraceae bacterium]|nr:hypothetical protein [Saprospiraceae bacterium]